MQRRQFILGGLSAAIGNTLLLRQAQAAGHMMPDKGHMPERIDNSISPTAQAPQQALLSTLPGGRPLRSLPMLANQNQAAGYFRGELVAAPLRIPFIPGKPTATLAYNGHIPGPQIVVNEGDWVEIHFKNHLHEPTTLHWHGLPVPADQDGNPSDPVAPGAERWYRFRLPEHSAGTYWYHPHPHGRTAAQVAQGLAGSLIVKAKRDPLAPHPEQHWLISDLRLNESGQIPANTMLDWLNGREGELVLINGQFQPLITLRGHERIRIWNACSARYLRLAVPGLKWQVVGSDGGLLEYAQAPVDELLLVPAQRVEVIAIGKTPAAGASLQNRYYDRKKMMVQEPPITQTLATLQHHGLSLALPPRLRTLPAWPAIQAHKQVLFSEASMAAMHSSMMSGGTDHTMLANRFLINGKTFDMQRVDWVSRVNQTEEWHLLNQSDMDHPFHLHGTQFEVTRSRFQGRTYRAPYRALRDTVNLRPGEEIWMTVRQTQVGKRMFHCHILEHEDLGMMATLNVVA